jgi:hypothetical protein
MAGIAKAHARGAAAVLVDEIDAGPLGLTMRMERLLEPA